MKKISMVLKKVLLGIILFYFFMCILYTLIMWTSNIGSNYNEFSNCDHPDVWVIKEPDPPDWVKDNPANDWLTEKWEAPEWTKNENK